MRVLGVFAIVYGFFAILDVCAYVLARFPERDRWGYKLPGGGFVALWRYGQRGEAD